MAALNIECYCTESQMREITEFISNHISNIDLNEPSSFDDIIGNIGISVEFDSLLDELILSKCEVYNWETDDVLDEDTAVLKSRLKCIVNDFNYDNLQLWNQSKEILEDRLFAIHDYTHY